jgi:hypothetical protein
MESPFKEGGSQSLYGVNFKGWSLFLVVRVMGFLLWIKVMLLFMEIVVFVIRSFKVKE